jgi:hypothetical protein
MSIKGNKGKRALHDNAFCLECNRPLPTNEHRFFLHYKFVNSAGTMNIRSVSERKPVCAYCAVRIAEQLREDYS